MICPFLLLVDGNQELHRKITICACKSFYVHPSQTQRSCRDTIPSPDMDAGTGKRALGDMHVGGGWSVLNLRLELSPSSVVSLWQWYPKNVSSSNVDNCSLK